jgi:hypothetical protein
MEILKDKKVLIGGLVLLGVVGYYFMTKKKKSEETVLSKPDSTGNITTGSTTPKEDNYAVTLGKVDPTGAVYLVLGEKKYPFISEKAWVAYGYSAPKTITKAQLDAIANGGFVNNDGKIVKA